MSKFFALFGLGMLCMFLLVGFGWALDRSLEQRDRMLCNSARASGNVEYLEKCECYYQGAEIRCIWYTDANVK